MGRGHSEEAFPAFLEDGQNLRERVIAVHAVAQDQGDCGIRRNTGLKKLIAIGSQLQKRSDLGMACKLCVEDGVLTAGTLDQEVGAAVELAIEERGLEHDVRPGAQGLDGFRMLGQKGGAVHGGGGNDVVNALSCSRIPGPELCHELVQDPVLVDIAELRRAIQHGICRELGFGGAAQFFVEFPEELVLTGGRDDKIAG